MKQIFLARIWNVVGVVSDPAYKNAGAASRAL
jgi:hypothetical protein